MNDRFRIIMLSVMMAVCLGASAFTVGQFSYEILSEEDRTVSITECSDDSAELVLPGNVEYDGTQYTVTSISNIFMSHSNRTAVKIFIPENIISIGTQSKFYGFPKLQEIIVDENNPVYTSVDGVLYNKAVTELFCCPILKDSVTLPSSLTIIKEDAFSGNKSISKICLPEGLRQIEDGAFKGCGSLSEISFPSSLEMIGRSAFPDCAFKSIELNDGLKYIDQWAFMECKNLEKVRIPASVELYLNPFIFCYSLTEFEVSPESELYSGDGPFLLSKDKSRLISYPSETESVTIPDDVSVIGKEAFYRNGLKTVVLPNSITEIEDWGFCESGSLERMYCYPSTPPKLYSHSINDTAGNTPEHLLIYVPAQYYEAYRTGWRRTGYGSLIRVMVEDSGIDESVHADSAGSFIVYDLDGRLVMQTSNRGDLSILGGGIYIVNGKKTLIQNQ